MSEPTSSSSPLPPSPPSPLSEKIPEIPKIEEFQQEIKIPETFPKKPKPYLKILIRGIIIVLFLLLLSGFLYWFFWVRKPTIEEPFIPPVEENKESIE